MNWLIKIRSWSLLAWFGFKAICGALIGSHLVIWGAVTIRFYLAGYGYEATDFFYSRIILGYYCATIILSKVLKRGSIFFRSAGATVSTVSVFLFMRRAMICYILRGEKQGFTSFLDQTDALYIASAMFLLLFIDLTSCIYNTNKNTPKT